MTNQRRGRTLALTELLTRSPTNLNKAAVSYRSSRLMAHASWFFFQGPLPLPLLCLFIYLFVCLFSCATFSSAWPFDRRSDKNPEKERCRSSSVWSDGHRGQILCRNKVELKHAEASPDVFLQYALQWEKSISVGYEVVLARSLDLFHLCGSYCAAAHSTGQKTSISTIFGFRHFS